MSESSIRSNTQHFHSVNSHHLFPCSPPVEHTAPVTLVVQEAARCRRTQDLPPACHQCTSTGPDGRCSTSTWPVVQHIAPASGRINGPHPPPPLSHTQPFHRAAISAGAAISAPPAPPSPAQGQGRNVFDNVVCGGVAFARARYYTYAAATHAAAHNATHASAHAATPLPA